MTLLTLPWLVAPASGAEAKRMQFGKLDDGTAIEAVELSNGKVSAKIITLGASVQSLTVPDRNGKAGDVVLGYATPAEYLAKPQYFGATVGRYANRIRAGKFSLDGKSYQLATNDGPNHLHGGVRGFDKVVWKIDSVKSGSPSSVVLSHVSPDGDGGYPGTLKVTATYSLNDKNELSVEYQATTDKPTIVNITNHSYFNLADGGDILGHRLTLLADAYTPVDATLIPTGERRKVAGTPFDFREPHTIGARVRDGNDEQIRFGRGYDHNYILRGDAGTLRLAAKVEDPASGRVMELLVTAPAVQFYSGNFLDGTSIGKAGRIYRQGDALCLEPQVFPDAPNHPDFPSARLNPGQTYTNTMVFRFSVAGN
ncbi:aldose epimerase family protein [Povalibacter sp.]|uniref:aldose epimerase family protein n=1 Tax=Povalibacter sp. TaxID=1962978 RepID=UPI002F3F54F5